MFFFKKIVASFLLPIPVSFFLILIGLFFLWFTRRQKTGKVLVSLALLVLACFGNGVFSNFLIRPLEQRYPPLVDFQTLKSVKWVVVLGGGSAVDPRLPASTYLSAASLFRLSEAIRIHNRLPQTKLIFSGRSGLAGVTPVAEIMAETAAEFGARPEKIIIEADSADTKDHPIYLKKIIGSDQFLLVSSASHMPRAVALFRKQGMRPIPAPTNYRAMQRQRSIPLLGLLPRPGPLAESNQAIHEYLGILWAKFRGLL